MSTPPAPLTGGPQLVGLPSATSPGRHGGAAAVSHPADIGPIGAFPPADGTLTRVDIGTLRLECGGDLPDVTLAVQCGGEPSAARDNIVLIEHALTGDSHVVGPADAEHPNPAGTYVVLTDSINRHDVGRGRGGVAAGHWRPRRFR
ncbi:hypothetical protein GCM10023094_21360 [Rhodococcus olei]|uniref:Homoserine O-acetyltransferase n=1 Tax=Rhodococcus olei TaxID=2161675 RepID=A0ABP8NYQ3_9NOCA